MLNSYILILDSDSIDNIIEWLYTIINIDDYYDE
jgi:hypothetical protein